MSEDKFEDKFNEEQDEDQGLTLTQKMQLEELIVETAFNNSFKIVTGRSTFEEIMDSKKINGTSGLMAHNPDEKIPIESLENMMAYFVETEEYEKCAEVRDIINGIEIDNELKEIITDVHIQS